MNKGILFLTFILLAVSLISCSNSQETSQVNTTSEITTSIQETTREIIGNVPEFQGLEDRELYLGETFDAMEGIAVIDEEDGDISYLVVVIGEDDLPLEDDIFTEEGVFNLTYLILDSDANTVRETISITVTELLVIPACDVEREGYVLTWCDDFTGEGQNVNENGVNLDNWGFQLGTGSQYGLALWGNNEQQYYRSENASVIDGELVIEAKQEVYSGMTYTSARLFTQETFSQAYGRFEALISSPIGEGLWPAFWLMPRDNVYGGWANSGEIDIMEARGRIPTEASSALHYGGSWPDNTYTSEKYIFEDGETINDYHLYAVEWDETEIRFYVDDVLYHTVTDWYNTGYDYPAPFNQPFYIIINLAVGGGFDGNRVPPASVFDEPVEMKISYVRVYQRIED